MRHPLYSLQTLLFASVCRIRRGGRYLQTNSTTRLKEVADNHRFTKRTSCGWFDRNIILASGPLRAMTTTTTTTSTTSNPRRQGGSKTPNTNTNEESSDQEDVVIDNPCWGSPTHCDLPFLLSRMNNKRSILYESPNYIVLSKPPDLRMDGPYPSTVHKLLTYWYPSNSLLFSNHNNKDGSLLEAVSKLHQHNHLEDNELRPCHQLDYATSGVLLVARTSAAAARASSLLEDRVPEKTYLALLEGHLPDVNAQADVTTLPSFSQEYMNATLNAIETAYRHSRRPQRKNDTFQGFQPPHAIFHKWKSMIQQQQQTSKKKKRKRPPTGICLSEDQWQEIYKPIQAVIHSEAASEAVVLVDTMDWKQLSLVWKNAFQQAADTHNDLFRQALAVQAAQDSKASAAPTLPTVFRGTDDNDQCLYIFAPLAQVPHDFSMRVPSTIDIEYADRLSQWHGPPDLDYKPSLTKCEILERTMYNGTPVTKVQLSPKTGRRHQLRVHAALLGHAILGDCTYNTTTITRTVGKDDQAAPPRMCLHAYSLAMPLLDEPKDWKVSAPDPFPIENGQVTIVDF